MSWHRVHQEHADMDINFLKMISEAPGVSGFEYGVGRIIRKGLEGFVDDIREDKFGNIFVTKGAGDRTIMMAAHLDEIGLIVKLIDEKGFIRFAKLGGVPDHILPSQRVIVHGTKGSLGARQYT